MIDVVRTMQAVAQMKRIGVIGPARCSRQLAALGEEVGRGIGQAGAVLVCGGLGGMMEAAARGAKSVGGLTIGILPSEVAADANPFIDIPIVTGLNEARNVIVARSSQAIVAIDGEFGTLSELAFALRFGIPVVGLQTWRLERFDGEKPNIIPARTPAEAVAKALAAISGNP